MNFVKRAILSVIKRKGKAFIMGLVLCIVANMVLIGLSIKAATVKSGEFARQKLGSSVVLEADMDKLAQQGGTLSKANLPQLTEDMIEDIKSLEHVAGYNYITSAMALTEGFDAVEVESEEEVKGNIRINGSGATPEVSISGALRTELLSEFSDRKSKLVDGRQINEEDSNEYVAMIEENLASKNNLRVGDKIKLKSLDGSKVNEFEIIGIFEAEGNSEDAMGMPFLSPYNKIYVPYKKVSDIKTVNASESIGSAVYYLDDPLNVESFKNDVISKNLIPEGYMLNANDSLYKQMMGPIENVASFSNIIVILVSIAGIIIMSLIIILSLKDRRYEIGVLLSIGESRIKIISQLLIEILLIAAIAFSIAIFTGKLSAENIGNSLLQREIEVSEEQNAVQEMISSKRTIKIGPSGVVSNNQSAEPIDEIDVSVTGDTLVKLGFLAIAIVMLSTVFPSISILRYNPRTILINNN